MCTDLLPQKIPSSHQQSLSSYKDRRVSPANSSVIDVAYPSKTKGANLRSAQRRDKTRSSAVMLPVLAAADAESACPARSSPRSHSPPGTSSLHRPARHEQLPSQCPAPRQSPGMSQPPQYPPAGSSAPRPRSAPPPSASPPVRPQAEPDWWETMDITLFSAS